MIDRAIVITDAHFRKDTGCVYLCSNYGDHQSWEPYKEVFRKVTVVARECQRRSTNERKIYESDNLRFVLVPDFGIASPFGVFRAAKYLLRHSELFASSIVFYRMPSIVSVLVDLVLHPPWIAVEVVGDPLMSLSKFSHVPWHIRFWARPIMSWHMRSKIRHAIGVAYVTKEFLQNRYPSDTPIQASYSNVLLDERWIVPPNKKLPKLSLDTPVKMAFVGSVIPYKGLHVLVEALKQLDDCWQLYVYGEGSDVARIKRIASESGISEKIIWKGFVPRERLLIELQDKHIFVMPSFTEGMPRALIEAMAIGLIPVASDVGGVGELLSPEFLCPPGNVECFRKKISHVINILRKSPEEYLSIRQMLYSIAREYTLDKMFTRRKQFYSSVLERVRLICSQGL